MAAAHSHTNGFRKDAGLHVHHRVHHQSACLQLQWDSQEDPLASQPDRDELHPQQEMTRILLRHATHGHTEVHMHKRVWFLK